MPRQLACCHPSHFSISAAVLRRRQEASRELRAAGRENGSSTTNCVSFQESLILCDMCHCLQIHVEPDLFSTLLHGAERLRALLKHFSAGVAQVQVAANSLFLFLTEFSLSLQDSI